MTNKNLLKCDRTDNFWDNVLYEYFPSKLIFTRIGTMGQSPQSQQITQPCKKTKCPVHLEFQKVQAFPKLKVLALFQISLNLEPGLLNKY